MNYFNYEITYLSDAPIDILKKRLMTVCEGAWEARRTGFFWLSKGSHKYRIFFEQEGDIKALLQAHHITSA